MADSPSLPSVAIIVPVRNEVHSILETLGSCLGQDYDGYLEVIVADALSSDGTREVIEDLGRSHPVRLVENTALLTPAGLNRAIDATDAEVVVRCDAHSILPPSYVARAVQVLLDTGAGNVGGVQRAVGTTPMQRGIAAAMTNPLGVGDAKFHRGGAPGPVDTVYLGVFPRSVLEELGGYDESLTRNQDYELNIRIRDAGHTVWFDPTLEVIYLPRPSLPTLWRQYSDYGRWKRQVIHKHPSSLKLRQAAPPLLVIGLGVATASLATPLRRVGALALAGYGAALGIAGIYEATTRRDPAALLSAPAIGIMHISWGIGFLAAR